jgi:hypothetical protein
MDLVSHKVHMCCVFFTMCVPLYYGSRARNRVYAKKSRARKQCEVAKMQDRLTKLQNENDMLEALLSRVVVENTSEDDEEASASV